MECSRQTASMLSVLPPETTMMSASAICASKGLSRLVGPKRRRWRGRQGSWFMISYHETMLSGWSPLAVARLQTTGFGLLLRERMKRSSFLSGSMEEKRPPPAAKIFRGAALGFARVGQRTRLSDVGARIAVLARRKVRRDRERGWAFMGVWSQTRIRICFECSHLARLSTNASETMGSIHPRGCWALPVRRSAMVLNKPSPASR